MERFSRIFVERPITTFVVVIIMIVLGINSIPKLQLSMMPDVEFPTMMVMFPAYGMNAREIEEKVISPAEKVLMTLQGIERIESRSFNGYGMIIINFKWGADMKQASIDLSEKLNMVSFRLPQRVKPMIFKFSPDMMPIMVIAISGKDWENINLAARELSKSIEKLDEVSYVMSMGLKKEEVQVEVDYQKLTKKGIGMSMVPSAILSSNYLISGGSMIGKESYAPVNVVARFKTLDDIKNILLPKGMGFPIMMVQMMSGVSFSSFMGPVPNVRLSDVASVTVGYGSSMAGAKLNGKESAFLVVQKRSGSNMIDACRRVREVVNNFSAKDSTIRIVMDQSKYMEESLITLLRNLLIGAISVVFVLMLFLRDFRVVMLVSASIPISLLFGIMVMYFSGMTINIMSLGGLALAVGMLIDNAIVVTESIYRHSELGKDSKKASYIGAGEVGGAITASTLTTISVFLPIAFMKGFAEKMFQDMALAVTYTLLASLLVSLSFVPSTSQFLIKGVEPRLSNLKIVYEKALKVALKRRGFIVSVILLLFVLSSLYLYKLGFSLMPTSSPIQFRVRFFLPKGTSPYISEKVANEIEKYFFEIKDKYNIEYIYSSYGADESDNMMMVFNMDSGYENGFVAVRFYEDRELPKFERFTAKIEKELFTKLKKEYPGIYLDFLTPMNFEKELFGSPVEVVIKGDDEKELEKISKEVIKRLSKLKFLRNIKASSIEKIKGYSVLPDQRKLSQRKISASQIAAEISAVTNKTKAGSMIYKGRILDIVVYPKNVGKLDIKNIPVFNSFGGRFKLSNVATVVESEEPFMIVHRDGGKVSIVSADIEGISQSEALKLVKKALEDVKLTSGYVIAVKGQVETTQKEIKQIIIAMLIGIALMFMIMAGEFESFVQPFIIMLTIPMGIIGIALVYLFVRKPVNIVAMIGALMLFGIVVNNGIVMVDQINRLRRKGKGLVTSIVEGATTRLRPILMTSLTTITALIPELVLGGRGREYHAPMAYTLATGLGIATFLTLFFIPVLYYIFSRKRN